MSNSAVTQFNTPPSVQAGQAFSCSVTLQNTGTDTWTPAASLDALSGVKLGSYPHDVLTWGPKRVVMPASPVAPGGTAVVVVSAVAPQSPGPQQRMQWQLVNEGVAWFGAIADAFIDVLPAPPPPPAPLSAVLTPKRPSAGDPSSGSFAPNGSVLPCLFDTGPYVAAGAWLFREFVNDLEADVKILRSYLWTGIDLGGVCDTHLQLTAVDADGVKRLLHVAQWDHYAQPAAPAGLYLDHNGFTLMPGEVLRVDYYAQGMDGKHAQHVVNVWVLR